ncbi:MAG: hypothetical protein EWM47_07910, partial [Anaerolineaceae bacterium]
MKISKIMSVILVVSLIIILAVACNRDNDLPDTKQENNLDETPVTIETDETENVDGTPDNQQENDISSKADVKEIIEAISEEVMTAISEKDGAAISEFTHPVKGLRFTPYTFVSLEN